MLPSVFWIVAKKCTCFIHVKLQVEVARSRDSRGQNDEIGQRSMESAASRCVLKFNIQDRGTSLCVSGLSYDLTGSNGTESDTVTIV